MQVIRVFFKKKEQKINVLRKKVTKSNLAHVRFDVKNQNKHLFRLPKKLVLSNSIMSTRA